MKKTLKFAMLLALIICTSTAAGYFAFKYFLTDLNDAPKAAYVSGSSEEAAEAEAPSVPLEGSEENPIEFDYYVARLDGNVLNIYISSDGSEYFLYSIDIYVKNIPYDDVKMLNKGIKLYSGQELTSFIEDYTS